MEPRVSYVGSFYKPSDLGIRRGLFSRLADGLTGRDDRILSRPMSVITVGQGRIVVADTGSPGLHVFDTESRRYRFYAGDGDSRLESPVALARFTDGKLLVSDSGRGRVYTFDPDDGALERLSLSASVQQPTGVAFDERTGLLYVSDTKAHAVLVFDQEGSLVRRIGERGTSPAQFNYPTLIWFDREGHVFVNDSLNFRVQVFDDRGGYIGEISQQGDGSGDLSRPKAVATDVLGHVYVTDALFHVFQVFDKTGDFLLSVGSQGRGAGEFWLPTGIYIDESNTIYVCDSYNGRVQMFRYIGGASE